MYPLWNCCWHFSHPSRIQMRCGRLSRVSVLRLLSCQGNPFSCGARCPGSCKRAMPDLPQCETETDAKASAENLNWQRESQLTQGLYWKDVNGNWKLPTANWLFSVSSADSWTTRKSYTSKESAGKIQIRILREPLWSFNWKNTPKSQSRMIPAMILTKLQTRDLCCAVWSVNSQ